MDNGNGDGGDGDGEGVRMERMHPEQVFNTWLSVVGHAVAMT